MIGVHINVKLVATGARAPWGRDVDAVLALMLVAIAEPTGEEFCNIIVSYALYLLATLL